VSVEFRRFIIFCMNCQRAHPDNIRNLHCTPQRVQEQAGTYPPPLPVAMHGQPRQDKKRYGMTGHAFDNALRRISVTDFPSHNRIVADNRLFAQADIGLRGIHLLGPERMTNEEPIKFRLAAGEILDLMSALQFFYSQWICHGLGSKTDGSRNSRSRRG